MDSGRAPESGRRPQQQRYPKAEARKRIKSDGRVRQLGAATDGLVAGVLCCTPGTRGALGSGWAQGINASLGRVLVTVSSSRGFVEGVR
jgi:hypothetical protein